MTVAEEPVILALARAGVLVCAPMQIRRRMRTQ